MLFASVTAYVFIVFVNIPWPANAVSNNHRHHHGDTLRNGDPDDEFLSAAFRDGNRDQRSKRHLEEMRPFCPQVCDITIPNMQDVRTTFQDMLEDPDTYLIHFRIYLIGYNQSVYDAYPYMANNYRADEWIWASQSLGLRLLSLPLDADVLSLYILDSSHKHINLHISSTPPSCLIMYSAECRLYAVRQILIQNVTYVERLKTRRDFVCHQIINQTQSFYSQIVFRCCDSAEFRSGHQMCNIMTSHGDDIMSIIYVINIISFIITLYSPLLVLKLKIALKFDSVTKFFRASLKHGITGQRNYVIRISSRQLINLNDAKPFSMPRFISRLVLHCYGEGRCCIHWWGEWRHQPICCMKDTWWQNCWFTFCRFVGVALLYPAVFYIAIGLYISRIGLYSAIVHFTRTLEQYGPIYLNVNLVAITLIPNYHPHIAIWMLFSIVAFVYTIVLLSWPNNPLERCLLRYKGKRPYEGPNLLYDRISQSYKGILTRLAYGDYATKHHVFRIRCMPWGIRRVALFVGNVLLQIPIINVCITMLVFDANMFKLRHHDNTKEEDDVDDQDETASLDGINCPSIGNVCKGILTGIVWIGFVLILLGYCTAIYTMTQFALNVLFFTLLGAVLNASAVLPWIAFTTVIIFYINDTLSIVNKQHRQILKLIDENSPRISAVEDREDVFRDGAVQILKTHNLGAVKFIDGDNTEYVSKELYYNVCTDLKCGWSRTVRWILRRMTIIVLYVLFVFLCVSTVGSVAGRSGVVVTIAAVIMSLVPKCVEWYMSSRSEREEKRATWAKIMPDILDRHIRVDRTQSRDQTEIDLTTYDVRPVGHLEMDSPKSVAYGALRLWKFPWVVSSDQQTQSHESFIVALGNKLAAASFLSKIVTRTISHDLTDETVLRQWCLLVENCILEGSSNAGSINGVPVESIRLFPRDVQPLVTNFETGNTIDHVVDNINRELYGPFTKGVLVTIGNTSFALGKIDNLIFAFNGSCHGEQVTDLFGAVLIMTDFNTQNLQTTIKYIMDPYSPDTVPVYSVVPVEGFVFRSLEILEAESMTESTITE